MSGSFLQHGINTPSGVAVRLPSTSKDLNGRFGRVCFPKQSLPPTISYSSNQSPPALPPPPTSARCLYLILSSCFRSNWNAMMVVQYIPKIFCCTYSTPTPAPHTSHVCRKQDNPGELLSILTAAKRKVRSARRGEGPVFHTSAMLGK